MSTLARNLALAFAFSFAGCAFVYTSGQPVVGSGNPMSEDRAIADVTSVRLQNVGSLTIKVTDREALTVKGDDNIVPLMESKVANGQLTLGLQNNTSVTPKTKMEYIVEVKSLDRLEMSGAASANVSQLDAKTFKVKLTGAGSANLSGKCDELTITGTGACKINAVELPCKKCKVDVAGASSASVKVEDQLDVTATGACAIDYTGDPKVSKKVTGASSVKKK